MKFVRKYFDSLSNFEINDIETLKLNFCSNESNLVEKRIIS